MASSGTVYTGKWYAESGSWWRVYVSWSSTQDIATNTSTIKWNAYVDSSSSGYVWINEISVWIGGSRVWYHGESNYKKGYDGTWLCGGTKTISHDDDGSGDLYVYIGAGIYVWDINKSGEYTYALPTIPRKATITAAPSFTDEDNPTITYQNLAGDAVTSLQACISLDGSKADVPYRDVSISGTSYTFNLTDTERNTLIDATTGSTSRTIYFYLKTILAGNTYYDKISKTFTVINGSPVLNPVAEIATDTHSYSLTGSQYKFIKGYTNVTVATGAEARKRATITSHYISNGTTVNSTTINAATGTIKAVNYTQFIFKATDSRGESTTATLTRELVDYIPLTIGIKVPTPTIEGVANLTVSGNYFNGNFGAKDNTLIVMYRYREANGEWNSWEYATPTINDNGTYTASVEVTGLDYRKAYGFQAHAIDRIYTKYSEEKVVRAIPVFDWGENDFMFNVPIGVNGVSMVDFVVEQGVDGDWKYRIWNSGRREGWLTTLIEGAECNIAFGTALYRTSNVSIPWSDKLFYSGSGTNLTYDYHTFSFHSNQGTPAWVWDATGISDSSYFSIILVRPSTATISGYFNAYFCIHPREEDE